MDEKIKKLLDELAAVVAEMHALMESEEAPAEAEGEEANSTEAEDEGNVLLKNSQSEQTRFDRR